MPHQVKVYREDPFYNDLNNFFIPYRTVLEMEALLGLYLSVSNYDLIKDVPKSKPSSMELLELLNMKENAAYYQIVDYFVHCALPKLKPIVVYERDHHDAERRGNVSPYAKTRACLYFALHSLKLKFLLIQEFFDKFKKDQYRLELPPGSSLKITPSLQAIFGVEVYEKYRNILADMLPKKTVSESVSLLMENKDAITNEKVFQMLTYLAYDEEHNKIKYIMRNIKASLFVCNLLFASLDLTQPFSHHKDEAFNPEEIMTSQDFIPELVPAASKCLAENNHTQLKRVLDAFDQLMNLVLDGINLAYQVASGGELKLGRTETLYQIRPKNR
jgi:hypothetical protein